MAASSGISLRWTPNKLDKLYYDEKRKRFLYLPDVTSTMQDQNRRNVFTFQRPDMWGFEHKDFDNKFRYAQRYLNFIQYLRRQEIKRLYYLLPETSYSYHWPLWYDYHNQYQIDQPLMNKIWTWDDATRMVNFVELEMFRAIKYGLHIPSIDFQNWTKEGLKEKEKELTDYFLHEMNKKPLKQGE